MAGIRVIHSIDGLAADMADIPPRARVALRGVVRDGIRAGNLVARENAKRSAGTHGKHYHKAFTAEMNAGLGLFGNTISGEYGPDIARPQGGMSFEFGSRNQKPHLDLARSADLIGPVFAREALDAVDGLFW